MKRPEVAADYRDLNYISLLEFVPEMEKSLENTRKLLTSSRKLIKEKNTEFQNTNSKKSDKKEKIEAEI